MIFGFVVSLLIMLSRHVREKSASEAGRHTHHEQSENQDNE